MKLRLVPDWRQVWRYWSARATAAALSFLTFIQAFPDAAQQAWQAIPADLRGRVPERTALAVVTVLAAVSLLSRFVKQKGPSDAAK